MMRTAVMRRRNSATSIQQHPQTKDYAVIDCSDADAHWSMPETGHTYQTGDAFLSKHA